MSTFTAIRNKAQGGGTMGRALDYVEQEKKTLWEERQLVTGWNCVARSAYDEMMATKRLYKKTDGRMFYQFIQSFDSAEEVTPEEVHAIGLELAQRLFPEYEVVVATHVDTEHLHNHLIVNSVSWKDGHKLHQNAADLQRQRQVNDEICMAHGLGVLEPPQKHSQKKQMRPGEYRSAVRGESWKFQLMNTVDQCMKRARTRADFIREMERRGYQVRWEKTRKAITYTTPKGKKCRDDRLHEDKYRKEVMEREFRIREEMLCGRTEREEPAAGESSHGGGVGQPAGDSQHAVPSDGGPVRRDDEPQLSRHEGTAGADRGAGAGNSGDPTVAGAERTGWETERALAFASGDVTQAPVGLALGHPDLTGLVGDVVQLGRALERDQSADHMTDSTTTRRHADSKTRCKERQKKTALGHKEDDHEEEQTWQQTM